MMHEPDSMTASQAGEPKRFEFGKNWRRYLASLNPQRIASAERSLRDMLEIAGLVGKTFVDVGSGSGIFSLAARRLGAHVRSFDYDPESVACTESLKAKHFPDDPLWHIERGSVMDEEYIAALGGFDFVYCWGVAHHTGDMWRALDNVAALVKRQGKLYVAIYNDQGMVSRYWSVVKRAYNANILLRMFIIIIHVPYLFIGRIAVRTLSGRLNVERGMSLWYDMIDWLGGFPFEVAKPEAIFDFFRQRGFSLVRLKTCGGHHGCNEFMFVRNDIRS